MKKFALATVCLVLLVIASSGAWADATGPQVTLSKGTSGLFSFWDTGSEIDFSIASVASTNCSQANCVAGIALLDDGHGDATNGNYWMWITGGPPTLAPTTPGNFTVGMGSSTLFLQIGLGTKLNNWNLGWLFGTVELTDLTGGTTGTPKFDGVLTVQSSSGLLSIYSVGSAPALDFTINVAPLTKLAPLSNGPTITGYVSSGELVPSPEPGTLALMGSGVLGLAGLIRRKIS